MQGETCYQPGADDVCAYRGENGLKCAVGILIPDGDVEEVSLSRLACNQSRTGEGILKHRQILEDLQFVHDFRDEETWATELRRLAVGKGLGDVVVTAWEDA